MRNNFSRLCGLLCVSALTFGVLAGIITHYLCDATLFCTRAVRLREQLLTFTFSGGEPEAIDQ